MIRSNGTVGFLPGFVLPLVGLEAFPSFDLASITAVAVGTEPSFVFRFFVTFESAGSSLSPELCAPSPFTCDEGRSKEFATAFPGDTCPERWCVSAPIPGLNKGSLSSSSSSSSSLSSSFSSPLEEAQTGLSSRTSRQTVTGHHSQSEDFLSSSPPSLLT